MSYNIQLSLVLQYFTNIAAIQNVGILQQIWLYEIIGSMLLMCQNTTMRVYEAWIKHIAFNVKKYVAPLAMCYNPPLVLDTPLESPASVKVVYCAYFPSFVVFWLNHWDYKDYELIRDD